MAFFIASNFDLSDNVAVKSSQFFCGESMINRGLFPSQGRVSSRIGFLTIDSLSASFWPDIDVLP